MRRLIVRRSVLAVMFSVCAVLPASVDAQQLVILVRHAERADGGATSGGMTDKPADPRLSPAGEARAARLAAMLAEAGLTAIYSTEFRRTQDTVGPLAAKTGVAVTTVPAGDLAALTAKITADPKGIVLVVGHSNTVPAIIKALGGAAPSIADSEYDNLFIYVPATRTLTRIKY
jgi:broad specificity phosphatase PhoE